MLTVIIEEEEFFNETTQEFGILESVVLELEHSLISLSKWESKHQKPFLSSEEKTVEELFDYVKAMLVTSDVNPDSVYRCSQNNVDEIQAYIDSSRSATTFGEMPNRPGLGEVITSELIYYWMVAFNIPFECQDWHLNRLFALIRICNIKNSKPEQLSRHEIAMRNRELNAKRREQYHTKG